MKRVFYKRRKPFRGGDTQYDRAILDLFGRGEQCDIEGYLDIVGCLGPIIEGSEFWNSEHLSRLRLAIFRKHREVKN